MSPAAVFANAWDQPGGPEEPADDERDGEIQLLRPTAAGITMSPATSDLADGVEARDRLARGESVAIGGRPTA
jgi:hypothetical protein